MLNIFQQQNRPERSRGGGPPDDKKTAPARPDFRKYVDPTHEFETAELSRALWLQRHRVLLYRLLVIFLGVFIFITWLYSLARFGEYLVVGIENDRRLATAASQFIDYTTVHARYAPEPLGVVSTRSLPGGVGKYDIIAELSNPNSRWLVRFDYWFEVDGAASQHRSAWLLPGEIRPVAEFGIESLYAPGLATIMIDNVVWRRVSAKLVPDTLGWQAERLNFALSNLVFIPANSLVTTTVASTNIIRFNLINSSAYGYKAPLFYAGLFQSGSLQQLMSFTVPEITSLESVPVDLRSFVGSLQVDEVKIFPLINVYDSAVYLKPPS